MGFIRLIHIKHWDRKRQRFQSLAFKSSTDNGISVIETECIADRGRAICEHVRTYYSVVAGEPVIFWEVPDDVYDGCEFVQETTDTGDDCHYNIVGLAKQRARSAIISALVSHFQICDDLGQHHPLTVQDCDTF